MSGFFLGIVIGCLVGVLGTLFLMLVVDSVPDGDHFRMRPTNSWRALALIAALMVGSGAIFAALNLHRVAFATSILLLLVFVTAHVKGMLASWVTLAVATIALCLVLPPANKLMISDSQDRILLFFFVLCGAIGTRLVAQRQQA
jgi:K+-sensing histidine kinase KdpD